MRAPTATVVVPTHRRPLQLARCLEALRALDPPAEEIVVIDNTGGDQLARDLARRFEARYLAHPTGGASAARNAGALLARSEVVAFTDDDGVPDPAWLGHHMNAHRDPAVGVSTGRVLPLGSTGEPLPTGHEGDLGIEPFRIDAATPRSFERTNFGGGGIGPNMAFRRSLLDRGWRFHERLGPGTPIPGCEEHRAFYDVVREGYALVYVPGAVVRHGAVPDADAARRRRQRILRASVAYAIMLAVEEPGARAAVGGELAAAVRGRGSRRAPPPGVAVSGAAARWDAFTAVVLGPLLYLQSRQRLRASGER